MKGWLKARRKALVTLAAVGLLTASACNKENGSSQEIDLGERMSDQELAAIELQKPEENEIFLFGFDLRASPQEDARQYLPFINYLTKATGLNFRLRFTGKNEDIVDLLGKGKVHFAAIGATSYIHVHQKYGATALVRGLNIQDKAEYRSVIIVHPSSPIRQLNGLRGKRFAFGSINSTQGHLIPRIVLSGQGVRLKDFNSYVYLGSHRSCADAVIAATVDACGLQDTMGEILVAQGSVRILHTSKYYPSSGIVAYSGLPEVVVQKVKQALLAFKPHAAHSGGLYNWHLTEMPHGFVEARDSDYQELRQWMRRLGFLQPLPGDSSIGASQ